MWWVLPGFVAGLIASSLMIIYWFYHVRTVMAEKGWRHTSRLGIFVWVVVFFNSAIGLARMSAVIQEGSVIDIMLVYTSAILILIALVAVVTGMMLDTVTKTRRA